MLVKRLKSIFHIFFSHKKKFEKVRHKGKKRKKMYSSRLIVNNHSEKKLAEKVVIKKCKDHQQRLRYHQKSL